MMVTLHKIGEVHFRLFARMVFMQRQRMKDLLLRTRVVLRTLKMKSCLPDYVEILYQKKRAARAAGTLVAFFDEVWEMTT